MNDMTERRDQVKRLFKELITAYGAKDFEAFARYIHAEAEFDWPYLPLKSFPDRMIGRDAFIATSKAGMADCDGYHHVVDRFYDMADPDMLLVEYHSATVLASTGQPYANKYLGILRFDGEEVTYWREYINPLLVVQAYGLDFVNEVVG